MGAHFQKGEITKGNPKNERYYDCAQCKVLQFAEFFARDEDHSPSAWMAKIKPRMCVQIHEFPEKQRHVQTNKIITFYVLVLGQ